MGAARWRIACPWHVTMGLHQLSWYASLLAIDGRREANGGHAFMPWKKWGSRAVLPLVEDVGNGSTGSDSTGTSGGVTSLESPSLRTHIMPAPPAGPPPATDVESGLNEADAAAAAAATLAPTLKEAGSIRAATAIVSATSARNSRAALPESTVVTAPDRQKALAAALAAASTTNLDQCDTLLEGSYGKLLMTTPAKVATMVVLLLVVALGAWGASTMRMGIDVRETLAPTSPQAAFFDDQDAFFNEIGLPVHVVFDSPLAYWDTNVAASITHLTHGVGASRWAPAFPPINSWFESFRAFVASGGEDMPNTEAVRLYERRGAVQSPH